MKRIYVNKDEIYNLYVTQQLSTRDVGKVIGIGQTSVRRWLKKYEIPTRSQEASKGTPSYLAKSKKMPKDIRQNTCNQELKRVLNVIKNLLSTAITKIRHIVQSNVYPNHEKTKRQNIIVNHAAGK